MQNQTLTWHKKFISKMCPEVTFPMLGITQGLDMTNLGGLISYTQRILG